MDTTRRAYRLKRWAQAWYLGWGLLFCVVGVHLISAVIASTDWSSARSLGSLPISFGFPALGCYFFALALRSRVVLEGTRITVRYAIREKSADLSQITGRRTYAKSNISFWLPQFRGVSFWHLQLRERGGCISIAQLFHVDGYFHSWLRQLPDLDKGSLPLI